MCRGVGVQAARAARAAVVAPVPGMSRHRPQWPRRGIAFLASSAARLYLDRTALRPRPAPTHTSPFGPVRECGGTGSQTEDESGTVGRRPAPPRAPRLPHYRKWSPPHLAPRRNITPTTTPRPAPQTGTGGRPGRRHKAARGSELLSPPVAPVGPLWAQLGARQGPV